MKFKQAVKAVDECACVWVVYGETVRDAKLDEVIRLRSEQIKLHEPIAMAELPGVVFQEPACAASTAGMRRALVREANRLVAGVA